MISTVTLNPAIDKTYYIEGFNTGSISRTKGMQAVAGGKGLNVTKVLKTLDEEVRATGFIGGYNGRFIADELAKNNIYADFQAINGETRTCLGIVDISNGVITEIREEGPVISECEKECFLKKFETVVGKSDLIAASGSLPLGVQSDFYCELINISKKHGKDLLLDTSGIALRNGLKACPSLIKPNIEEAEYLFDCTIKGLPDLVDVLKRNRYLGVKYLCITLGKDGVVVMHDDNLYKAEVPKVDVVNSVGSGDSFIAGFASGILKKYNIEDIIKLACACGVANTQFMSPGTITLNLVQQYFDMIKVTRI